MDFVAWNIDDIAGSDFMLIVAQAQAGATVQHIHAVLVRVLIERGMAARLYREIAHMKVWRVFVAADQDLARGAVGPAVLRAICTHGYALPAEFAAFGMVESMYHPF